MPRAAASSRPCGRPARPARTSSSASRCATGPGCGHTARRRSRASRATASTATPSSRSCAAIRAAGGVPTWLGAHTVPPEFDDADDVPRLPARGRPARGRRARGGRRRLPRARLVRRRARPGATCEACRDAGLALRLHGDQFTESGAIALAIELGARSVDHLEATGPAGVARLAASDVTGVLLPASALFLGRPMPPARALADAGALVALATDFNPGSAFCDSLPLVLSLACTQMKLAPEEALVAATVNAAHVLGRADRIGRLRPGLRGRRRAARRTRLAPRRLPPRRRHRPHRGRRRSGRVPAHGIIPAWQRRSSAGGARRRSGTTTTSSTSTRTVSSSRSSARTPPRKPPGRVGKGSTATTSQKADACRQERSAGARGAAAVVAQGAQARRHLRADLLRHRDAARWRARCTIQGAIVQTVLLIAVFIPFSYFMDRVVWRQQQKRLARDA